MKLFWYWSCVQDVQKPAPHRCFVHDLAFTKVGLVRLGFDSVTADRFKELSIKNYLNQGFILCLRILSKNMAAARIRANTNNDWHERAARLRPNARSIGYNCTFQADNNICTESVNQPKCGTSGVRKYWAIINSTTAANANKNQVDHRLKVVVDRVTKKTKVWPGRPRYR